jgi:hypothetical protein
MCFCALLKACYIGSQKWNRGHRVKQGTGILPGSLFQWTVGKNWLKKVADHRQRLHVMCKFLRSFRYATENVVWFGSEDDRFNSPAHQRFFNRRLERTLSISFVRELSLNSQFTSCIAIFLSQWLSGDLGALFWFMSGCQFTSLVETRCCRKSS